MARVYPLFSSSKGNATFIGTEKGGILIDAGVSCKRLMSALAVNNIPAEAVQGIFITHGHSDHIAGLKLFTSKIGCAVYGQKKTLRQLADSEKLSPNAPIIELTGKISVCGRDIGF